MTVVQYKKSKLIGGTRKILIGTAGEELKKNRIVCKNADGKLIACSPYMKSCNIVGITIESTLAGSMVQYVDSGTIEIEDLSFGKNQSDTVYLGVDGTVTTKPPTTGRAYVVGSKITDTSFKIQIP